MADSAAVAHKLLIAHQDAWLAQPGRTCGGGIAQPNDVHCRETGTWGLRGYVHAYCPIHARQRLDERVEINKRARGETSP